jgi:hypothetical protein
MIKNHAEINTHHYWLAFLTQFSSDGFADGTSISTKPRECFESVGDPALLYFLRILLLGDEDCLKADNYLIKLGEESKPIMVGIDFGMVFYHNSRRLKSSKSKEDMCLTHYALRHSIKAFI